MPAPNLPEPAERVVYEYAVIRAVPRVERGEMVNVGVVIFCKERRFLEVAVALDERRVRALDPQVDLEAIAEQLEAMDLVAKGAPGSDTLSQLSPAERFRWLVSPRSTVVQTSAVHLGECIDPAAELEKLMRELVRVDDAGG